MATRDLRFNVFANDRASAAFAKISAAAENLSNRLVRLDGQRAAAKVEVDTSNLEAKLKQAEAHLDNLNRKRADPRIDANITLAEAKIRQFEAQLEDLNRKRIRPEVQAEIGQAQQRIADLTKRLEELGRQRPSPVVTMQTGLVNQQIANIRREIERLGASGADPQVRLDIDVAQAQITKLRGTVADLNRLKASPEVDANIAAAMAKIALIKRQLADLRGESININAAGADRVMTSLVGKIRDVQHSFVSAVNSTALFTRNLRQITIPASLTTAVPTLSGLGAALMTAAQAAAVLPGAFAFAAAGVATLTMGFHDLGRAIGPRDTSSQIKTADLEMSRLGAQAQNLARTVIDLKDEWNGLKKSVQDRMFADLAGTFRELAVIYMPELERGFGGIAGEFNILAKDTAVFMRDVQQVNDVNVMFSMFRQTVEQLRPAFGNILAAFMDLSVVGSSFLPQMAAGFTEMTARFRDFIQTSRDNGDLQLWIAQGLVAMQDLGDVVQNVGGIFGAFFEASASSGASLLVSLKTLTGEARAFLQSGEGQTALVSAFQSIKGVVDALMPAVKALLTNIGEGIVLAEPAILSIAVAFGAVAEALAPTIPMLASLASNVIPPIATGFTAVATALGPLLPMLMTFAVTFKMFDAFGGALNAMGAGAKNAGERMGMMALAVGASGESAQRFETAGTKMSNVLGRIGNSLPLIGTAIVGLIAVYDQFGSKSDELAEKVVKGSMSVQQAIAEEQKVVEQNYLFYFSANQQKQAYADAANRVTAAVGAQLAVMTPLERATADVALAEANYNDQVRIHGERSREASTAADILKGAKDRLTSATDANTRATETSTEAMVRNAQEVSAAANADVALERANLNLESQQRRTTEALKQHGAASMEGRQATNDLMSSYLAAAEAAQRKASADAVARGEADHAAQGARAYRDRLLELAGQAGGDTRQKLLDMANSIQVARDTSNNAEASSRLYKEELARLAGQASGPLREALLGASRDFDNMGGAAQSAQGKAEAQRDALLRLASTASGPLRTELLRMADQIRTLPDGDFQVTGTGVTAFRFGPGGEVRGGPPGVPTTGRADGGVLPGYTPGRDVHTFASPTAGLLALSGGEAVMRPEWTRAVGKQWIDSANAAARTGGVAGVANFVSRTSPRPQGLEGRYGDGNKFSEGGVIQRLAMGGYIHTGKQFMQQPPEVHINVANRLREELIPRIRAELKRMEEAAGSGPTTAGAAAALNWGRTQVGKPYLWGGVGPGGYDCSGFMSALVNVMRGRNPHSRVGATGSFPWPGFQPGIGPGLNIGSFRGDPGHMAGTIGGVNVESSGGVGVRVGGGARGANNSMFTTRAHLADQGSLLKSGEAAFNLSGRAERVLDPNQTQSFHRLVDVLGTMQRTNPASQIGGDPTTEISRLRSDMQVLGETIRTSLSATRPITVEDRSGNPVETARATQLALRLG